MNVSNYRHLVWFFTMSVDMVNGYPMTIDYSFVTLPQVMVRTACILTYSTPLGDLTVGKNLYYTWDYDTFQANHYR